MKVKDWSVRRAFKGMTITGLDHRGRETKVADIEAIAVKGGRILATDRAGKKHELVFAPQPPAHPAPVPA